MELQRPLRLGRFRSYFAHPKLGRKNTQKKASIVGAELVAAALYVQSTEGNDLALKPHRRPREPHGLQTAKRLASMLAMRRYVHPQKRLVPLE